jgi:hypothetical protein
MDLLHFISGQLGISSLIFVDSAELVVLASISGDAAQTEKWGALLHPGPKRGIIMRLQNEPYRPPKII